MTSVTVKLPKKFFKIIKSNTKIGVVAETFQELAKKCKENFNLDDVTVKLKDGTEVDEEYFEMLENNEELFIGDIHSLESQILARLEKFLQEYKKINIKDFDKSLKDVLQSQSISEMLFSLAYIEDASICHKSTPAEDERWFKGLDTKYRTKEEVLRNSAENRMRGYFQKLKKDLSHCKDYPSYLTLVDNIHIRLKSKRFNADYFDRSVRSEDRLCNSDGLFKCDGDFLNISCSNGHHINPYKSREERIIFSTWNFDHVIEKSREVIPLVKASIEDNPKILLLNVDYLFELMFEHQQTYNNRTVGNLKLVHIVCHNKNPHKLCCDKRKLLHDNSAQLRKKRKKAYF